MRANPIVNSLTRPLNVKGCAYEFFLSAIALSLVSMFICMLSQHSGIGIFGGLGMFGMVFYLGKYLTKKDPHYLTITVAPINRKRSLDPKKRKVRALGLKEC